MGKIDFNDVGAVYFNGTDVSTIVLNGEEAWAGDKYTKVYYNDGTSAIIKTTDCSGIKNKLKIVSVKVGTIVTSIGSSAFGSCSSLASIEIPSSVTSIGSKAFYGCFSLTSITIPSSVTSIGSKAFYECLSLISVYSNPTTPPTLGIYAFSENASTRKIYVPSGSVNAYKSATNWNLYASYIVAQ